MDLNLDAVGKRTAPRRFEYDWRDCVLYALSVGATESELTLLTELEGPKVLPTFAVVPAFEPMVEALGMAGANIALLVHGQQRIEVAGPIPPEATLETVAWVDGIYDKEKGAVVVLATESRRPGAEPLLRSEWQMFIRGQGGWGGPRGPEPPANLPPEGAAAAHSRTFSTARTQALLYRLNGDPNPIHASPEIAALAGFERPILHGLCVFGFAARAAIAWGAGGDATKLRAFTGRFAKITYPGDELLVEGWNAGPDLLLRAAVPARGVQVLTHARAEFVRP
jgi:acyl dehydratase